MFFKRNKQAAAVAGKLEKLERGLLLGYVNVSDQLRGLSSATIEVFAHGIPVCTQNVPLGAKASIPFAFPLTGFPDVALPCTLRARIVETDTVLESSVELSSPEEIWPRMMPFKVVIDDKLDFDTIVLRVEGAADVQPVFELRDWGRPVATSESVKSLDARKKKVVLRFPREMFDGNEHRLTIVHKASGIPVTTQPIFVRLDVRTQPGLTLSDVAARLEKIEGDLRLRFAEAFHAAALPLYHHVDNVVLNQRSNFEREISSLRRLIGLDDAPRVPQPLPTDVTVSFEDVVAGYGVLKLQNTATGKCFRYVAPQAGFLLPGFAAVPARLRIQGIRRSHPGALDGAVYVLNGVPLRGTVYCSSNSESWNITADVPSQLLRPDKNLLELRLPNGVGEKETDHAVGILFVSLTSIEAQAEAPKRDAAAEQNFAAGAKTPLRH